MDPTLIFTLDVEKLSQAAAGLPREAIRVATLFDGRRRLWEVLRDSTLTSRMTISVFGKLRALELVRAPGELPEKTPAPEPALTPTAMAAQETLDQTQRLPRLIAETAPPAETRATPVVRPAPDPVAPPTLEVEAPDSGVTAPPTAATATGFDAADHAFFDSYEPEDPTVDTFWDLEDNPRKQRAARALQRRLNRRRRPGGWLAQLLLS